LLLRSFCLIGLLLSFTPAALALQTSPNALRIVDNSEGNLLLGADEARIEAGELFNSVVLLWGNLEIYGQVEEVVVVSGHVVFHEGSQLTKSLVVMGGSFESKPGAAVAAEKVVFEAPGPLWRVLKSAGRVWQENIGWVSRLVGALVICVVLWGLGMLLFTLLPGVRDTMVPRLFREWPQNLFVGALGSLVVPVFMVLLVISIVGIFLLPLFLIFLVAGALTSYLGAALWVGYRILPPRGNRRALSFLLGLLALQLLWASGFWWAVLPALFVWTLAWGALLRGLRKLWR
jgi:hypothetical protein